MKEFTLTIICLVIIMSQALAQDSISLYKKKIPNYKENTVVEEFTVSDWGHKVMRLVSDPQIKVYLPKNVKSKVPAVIIFPGGGYYVIAYQHEGIDVAEALNKMGIAAIVVKYRLPNDDLMTNKSIVPLTDAQQAIKTVRKNAGKWNIDKDRVGIMGFSAGGHLAATAGTHFNDRKIKNKSTDIRPNFMALIYPVISFSDTIGHIGSRDNLIGKNASAEQIKYFSNELHVTKETPPAFFVHAKDDGAVPVVNSLDMYERLKANHIATELFLYDKGGHGFGLINPTEPNRLWLPEFVKWLKNLPHNK